MISEDAPSPDCLYPGDLRAAVHRRICRPLTALCAALHKRTINSEGRALKCTALIQYLRVLRAWLTKTAMKDQSSSTRNNARLTNSTLIFGIKQGRSLYPYAGLRVFRCDWYHYFTAWLAHYSMEHTPGGRSQGSFTRSLMLIGLNIHC